MKVKVLEIMGGEQGAVAALETVSDADVAEVQDVALELDAQRAEDVLESPGARDQRRREILDGVASEELLQPGDVGGVAAQVGQDLAQARLLSDGQIESAEAPLGIIEAMSQEQRSQGTKPSGSA